MKIYFNDHITIIDENSIAILKNESKYFRSILSSKWNRKKMNKIDFNIDIHYIEHDDLYFEDENHLSLFIDIMTEKIKIQNYTELLIFRAMCEFLIINRYDRHIESEFMKRYVDYNIIYSIYTDIILDEDRSIFAKNILSKYNLSEYILCEDIALNNIAPSNIPLSSISYMCDHYLDSLFPYFTRRLRKLISILDSHIDISYVKSICADSLLQCLVRENTEYNIIDITLHERNLNENITLINNIANIFESNKNIKSITLTDISSEILFTDEIQINILNAPVLYFDIPMLRLEYIIDDNHLICIPDDLLSVVNINNISDPDKIIEYMKKGFNLRKSTTLQSYVKDGGSASSDLFYYRILTRSKESNIVDSEDEILDKGNYPLEDDNFDLNSNNSIHNCKLSFNNKDVIMKEISHSSSFIDLNRDIQSTSRNLISKIMNYIYTLQNIYYNYSDIIVNKIKYPKYTNTISDIMFDKVEYSLLFYITCCENIIFIKRHVISLKTYNNDDKYY